jgi:pimeloyl-[acyl-carrier protein] methyl ester esterase
MKLALQSTGNGPDLALIHGWGLSGAVWQTLVPALAEHCRVHVLDLPGYGLNRSIASETLSQTADLVAEAIPAGATLCGWSLGAQVALSTLARHDRHVGRLALVAATPAFVQRPDWAHGVQPMMLDSFAALLKRDPKSLLARFAMLINQGDAAARELTRLLAQVNAQDLPDGAALEQGLAQLGQLDLRTLLPKIPHPTLIVHGDSDPLMPLAAAQWTASVMPAARLEVFAGAAHAPFLSQPERFVDCLVGFVKGEARPA